MSISALAIWYMPFCYWSVRSMNIVETNRRWKKVRDKPFQRFLNPEGLVFVAERSATYNQYEIKGFKMRTIFHPWNIRLTLSRKRLNSIVEYCKCQVAGRSQLGWVIGYGEKHYIELENVWKFWPKRGIVFTRWSCGIYFYDGKCTWSLSAFLWW